MSSVTPQAEFPFESRYVDVLDSRMHYIDEGRGPVMLFLHGNPTSSYLWRNVIPHLAQNARCIAPDLIGMGRSGKPDIAYSFFDHARYLDAFIDALGLDRFTLVVHDWGSALGFHHARRHPKRVRALAFMEALIEPQKWSGIVEPFRTGLRFIRMPVIGWLLIIALNGFIKIILPRATLRALSREERMRYAAPPGGLIRAHDIAHARATMPHLEVAEVGRGIHYLQEDCPASIGRAIARWYAALPSEAGAVTGS